jgi:hypothetical protein
MLGKLQGALAICWDFTLCSAKRDLDNHQKTDKCGVKQSIKLYRLKAIYKATKN